jgi:hypothetical protein
VNNQDIHKDFDRAEVRDFLAQELERASKASGGVNVEWLMAEIERYQELLKAARHLEATVELMHVCGWEDWDISDEVPFSQETYFPFVGTEDEYVELLRQIDQEKKASE